MTAPPPACERPSPRLDGVRVLVAGGLGSIGSCLTLRLVDLGAAVTVVDRLLAEGVAGWRTSPRCEPDCG